MLKIIPLFFHEEWADQAGLDAHNEQPYIKAFGEKAKDFANDIVIYSTIKTCINRINYKVNKLQLRDEHLRLIYLL